jgi:hypothetical protein
MRTKDEILDQARQDITSPEYGDTAHLWLDVRKIEVLIDIRDILELRLREINSDIYKIAQKD